MYLYACFQAAVKIHSVCTKKHTYPHIVDFDAPHTCMCKMQNNRLSGALGVSSGFNHLSIAYIQNNTFNLTATLAAIIAGGHVTDLDAANNV